MSTQKIMARANSAFGRAVRNNSFFGMEHMNMVSEAAGLPADITPANMAAPTLPAATPAPVPTPQAVFKTKDVYTRRSAHRKPHRP